MKSILDPTFKYTSSANTDIAKTFRRVRREQAEAAEKLRRDAIEKVTPIQRKGNK